MIGRLCTLLSALAIAGASFAQGSAPKAAPQGNGGAPASKPATPPASGTSKEATKKPRQVFILSQKGMVGAGLRHEEMEAVEKEADKYGPGQIIVLRINSGGGDVTEGDRIVRTLSRVREKHRLVAWIEEAISGAAYTAFNCREIYFLKIGTMGSITKFSGDGSGGQKSSEGRDREAWSDRVAEVAEAGGHNPIVARAMVWSEAIASYTKDPKTGKVTFYPDKTGEVILSDERDNLTFNADNALACGYINGVADTDKELFQAMQLAPGTFELNEAGKRIGDGWEKTMERARKDRAAIEQDFAAANKVTPESKKILKLIDIYRRIQELWKKAPPVAEGMGEGAPLIPPEVEQLAPDLGKNYRLAPDGAGKAKVVKAAIDRCIEELKKKMSEAKKSEG